MDISDVPVYVLYLTDQKTKLHMYLPPTEMDVWWSWTVSCMIFSGNKCNRMGESKHPWRTPTVVWRTPLANCSTGLHCWSFHRVPEWLEPVLPLYWNFWRLATDLHDRLCQTPSLSLWNCGTDHAGVVGASLWWLNYWRSVLCSSLV